MPDLSTSPIFPRLQDASSKRKRKAASEKKNAMQTTIWTLAETAAAQRIAEEEGLALVLAPGTATGYKGVSLNPAGCSKPFKAQIKKGGENHSLGSFSSVRRARLAQIGAACAPKDTAATPAED